MRDAPGLLLDVVRGEEVILRPHERLEVPPRRARHAEEVGAVLAAERAVPARHRLGEAVRDERGERPEEEERRRGPERARAPGEDEEQAGERHGGARRHGHEEQSRPRLDPGPPRGARGGGLPLEQAAPRDGEPDHRDEDRVHHRGGLAREEGELQHEARGDALHVLRDPAQEGPQRLVAPRAGEGLDGERDEREREGPHDGGGPDRRAARQHGPAEEEQDDRRGRDLRAPQVVEDLPARDEGQAVPREARLRPDEGEEPAQDLPVAAGPAVLAARVGEDARRVVVHHLDVRHEAGAGVDPLEQVVGEERVVGDAPLERRREGVHVVEPLAREAALAEEVLVRVGDGGRVRVHAGVPGEDPREARAGGAGRGDADARLQDAVALGDAAGARIEHGPVERVRDDAHELLRPVPRQARVRVERDAVAHVLEDAPLAHLDLEARVGRPAQEPVQLLELPALALPAHPGALPLVPLPHAVEEEEAVPPALAEAGVQRLDAAAGRGEDGFVPGQLARRGVGEVAEDGEVDAGVEVPEREDLEVLELPLDALHAGEQRGHDHQGARVLRDAGREIESRQPPRRREARREALDDGDGHLARGHEEEQRHEGAHPGGRALVTGVGHAGGDERGGRERERPEVERRGVGEHEPPEALPRTGAPREVGLELAAPPADEVVADVGGPRARPLRLGRLARALHRAQRDAHLGLAGALGELLDRLPVAVAGEELHAAVHAGRVALQHPLDQAHALDELGPVEGGAEPQARDDVRDGDLGGGLALVLAPDGLLGRGPARGEVRVEAAPHRREAGPVLPRALEELHDQRRVQRARQRRGHALAGGVDERHVGVGVAPGGARGERLLREAPEVLDEGELQHARPGPQLAEGERGDRLEGVEVAHDLGAVEAAVAVADQLHGQRVHAGGAGAIARGERRQLAVVAAREVLADVPDLGGDEVVVVEEPLPRRRHELAAARVAGERAVRRAQQAHVVVEARKDAPRPAPRRVHREAAGERAGALVEALHAQQLVAERPLRRPGRGAEWTLEEPRVE